MKFQLKIWIVCLSLLCAAASADTLHRDRLLGDFQRLAAHSHRLPGSDAFSEAVDLVDAELRRAGLDEVHILNYDTWMPELTVSEMRIGDTALPLLPVRPNLVIWPDTPAGGLTGTLRYVGAGNLTDYGAEPPGGQIVLMDYASAHNWRSAFALGARAVVFVGRDGDVPFTPVHVTAPVNFPRFYIHADALPADISDLNASEAELHVRVRWTPRSDRMIFGRIHGTATDRRDPLVLSAPLDTFGNIPHRSPGARGAANAALLLEYARHFAAHRPERDVAFLFEGSRSYNHQGARHFYEAFTIPPARLNDLLASRREEQTDLRNALEQLDREGLAFETQSDTGTFLRRMTLLEAEYLNDNLSSDIQRRRLRVVRGDEHKDTPLNREIAERVRRRLVVDDVRRALFGSNLARLIGELDAYRDGSGPAPSVTSVEDHTDDPDDVFSEIFPSVLSAIETGLRRRFTLRLGELAGEIRFWERASALRGDETRAGRVHLHLSLNLGDTGPRWGLVTGDPVNDMTRLGSRPGADDPGNYVRFFSQLNQLRQDRGDMPGLNVRTLNDPRFGATFAGMAYTTSARVAGSFGVFSAALMTENDSRLRDGHPADVAEALDLEAVFLQGQEILSLLEGILAHEDLAVTRPVARLAQSKFTDWRNGRPQGDFATRTVVGGLSESRPAENSLIAHWAAAGGGATTHWQNLQDTAVLRDFMPLGLARANQFGRFSLIGSRALDAQTYLFGAFYDEAGELVSLSNQPSQTFPRFDASFRINLFSGRGHGLITNPGHKTFPDSMNILRGTTNFPFHNDRVLWGTVDDVSFVYLAERDLDGGMKIFQRLGPVVMALPGQDPETGEGVPTETFRFPLRVSAFTADNLWELNENRLSAMRTRGVSRTDLETFHSRALAIREQAGEGETLATEESLLLSSASISHRLHGPLRGSMDDLVTAIIFLLLLSLPFAFALERLLVGASSVYGRVAGFCGFFTVTFALLYFLHPGFALASAPLIIFLAFTVLGLSAMVIQMLLRRFKQELKLIQGQGGAAHDAEISRAGTTLAAIGMGMSTMRRRPTRTFLTAITVLALTFTILSFASFTREIGVRSTYLGPTPEHLGDGILIRSLMYSPLPRGQEELLQRYRDGETTVTTQWWLSRSGSDAGIYISNPATGDSVELEALLGLDPEEPRRWPALAETVGDSDPDGRLARDLEADRIFLPPFVMDTLNVRPGDTVRVRGLVLEVAEPLLISRMQALRGMDMEPLIPLDPRQTEDEESGAEAEEDTLDQSLDVEMNFVRLGVGEIAVTSNHVLRELGGRPRVMTLYPSERVNTRELGQTLASIISGPVWVVSETGVERMVLTQLTQVSGVFAIAIPLVLGGLIIFGTLLGSISDREKEIYTFSALGLGPSHVGLLFFAEAGVYAVVGGMGGQLIAQIVARVATILAARGIIEPLTINFSSTNSLFAIGIVMLLVLVSSIYPAYRASKSANPGLARDWKIPDPVNDRIDITFPFTVSAYDITGVVSFLAEHFRSYDDAGFGNFATTHAEILRNADGQLALRTEMALAPFDLGVTEELLLSASPSDIEGVDEVNVLITRKSGSQGDWVRGTHVFLKDLRTQFLMWRTLSDERIEQYRQATATELGETL